MNTPPVTRDAAHGGWKSRGHARRQEGQGGGGGDVRRQPARAGEIQVMMCGALVKMIVLEMMAALLNMTSVRVSSDVHVTLQW